MKLEDFVKSYIGKKVDFDGAFGAQCVDLFRQYNRDVWGNPHTGAVEGAKDLFLNYKNMPEEKKYLRTVGVPAVGDVVVWNKTDTNKYGHVAILIGWFGDDHLIVFEQDGLKQDGAKLNLRERKNILGYLRKR